MTKKEILAKLDEIVSFSGCERYIDTPVKRYSSGMKVRLAFAVAAYLEPDILGVDEVLAVGDAEFQKKAIGKMQDISSQGGRTVLFVSHNMGAVKSLCKTGIVLKEGSVSFRGTADEAINFYLKLGSEVRKVNLRDRIDRAGNGKVQVAEVSFENSKNEKIEEAISGDELYVKIIVKKINKIEFKKLVVVVNFMDEYENFVLSYISDEMGSDFEYLEESDQIILKIPNLYLRSSTYKLRILLSEGTPEKDTFLDSIEDAACINVLEGDIWKVGELNRKGSYAILPGDFI
jgi:lipopolysaccharide transport system ATP-binding protein